MSVNPLDLAAEQFDLAKWCERVGFSPQGFRREEWIHDCPFCGEHEKLSVNIKRRKWRCFVCHHRFRLTDLVAAFEGSYHQAVQVILIGGGLRQGSLDFIPELEASDSLTDRPADWQPDAIAPPPYFTPLTDHVAYTRARGFELEHLVAAGVGICSYGRYQDRLVFPVRRYPDAGWLYFQTRATWEKADQLEGDYRKNLNPAAADVSRHATPSDVLMGLDWIQALGLRSAALVEGPTDWLGFGPGAVVSFGTKLSDRQIGELARAGLERIDMGWDPDAWQPRLNPHTGELRPAPARGVAERLSVNFDVAVIDYPQGTDPGAHTIEYNRHARERARPWASAHRLAFIP